MWPHVVDDSGVWRAPFIYPIRLVDRLERTYQQDRAHRIPLLWFSDGRLVRAADESRGPWLLLGADSLGRDVFSRLVLGTRVSVGVAALALTGALFIGVCVGGIAGYVGGLLDDALMRLADFVLVLPAIYVVLALRAAMPLVLPASVVFVLVSSLLAIVAWPHVARGVRAIVATESRLEYAEAARSLGAGHARIVIRHLLPSTTSFLFVQIGLLVPAFVLAEATLSFVGLGFTDPATSWGSMLREAANIRSIADFPWLLSPALAMLTLVGAINLLSAAHADCSIATPVFSSGPQR